MLNAADGSASPQTCPAPAYTDVEDHYAPKTADVGILSDDEYYDCKSNFSSTKASLETAASRSNHSVCDLGATSATLGPSPLIKAKHLRSRVSVSSTATGDSVSAASPPVGAMAANPLRRSATTRASHSTRHARSTSTSHLVEERARRAVRAMAEAVTTGISVREASGRRVGSSSSEQLAVRTEAVLTRLHPVPLHNRTTGKTAEDARSESAIQGSALSESDSRSRSLTSDRRATEVARSASLEARVDRSMRERLRRWIMCFGMVHFDVDQGPTLHLVYPHVEFSSSERAAISFSSMPDSTIHELYDSVYTFNFRVDPLRLGLPKDRVFLHGHVFFRQKRDPLMRRGGFQRSVVIISQQPFHGLFTRLAHALGPLCFDLGPTILEAAAHNVAAWPEPVPGAVYELPFLGMALSVALPPSDASQLLETSGLPLDNFDPGDHILAGVAHDGLFSSFRDALEDLWACWELMILGESLVVLADTPARCSEAIVGLVDIIFPIAYCGDVRPYFTIQDPDFRAIVSKTHVPPNTIVGVSNPFFGEVLSHWQHKLVLGSSARMSQLHGANRDGPDAPTGSGGGGGGSSSSSIARQGLHTRHRCAVSKDRPFAEQLRNALRTGKQPPWVVNNMLRRYFIDLTVQFLAPLDRYFATLIPTVCSATAIPPRDRLRGASFSEGYGAPQTTLSWFAAPGALRPWRTSDFLASLVALGISPQLSGRAPASSAADVFASVFSGSSSSSAATASRGSNGSNGTAERILSNGSTAATPVTATSAFQSWKSKKSVRRISEEWLQLYTQFLKCGNFATWLAHRTNEAQRTLLARFREEVCRGDIHAWCRGYDYPLAMSERQLAAEIELLDLATMDLGRSLSHQPHVSHVFYHGQAEDERVQAERRRRQLLRDQRARLANTERPVYGSDGSLVGYTQRASTRHLQALTSLPTLQQQQQQQHKSSANSAGSNNSPVHKQLGQRMTYARRAQSTMLQAAWQIVELLGDAAASIPSPLAFRKRSSSGTDGSSDIAAEAGQNPPSAATRTVILAQLSILLEYLAPEDGRVFLPVVADDYEHATINGQVAATGESTPPPWEPTESIRILCGGAAAVGGCGESRCWLTRMCKGGADDANPDVVSEESLALHQPVFGESQKRIGDVRASQLMAAVRDSRSATGPGP
ncbi:hypothetical protein H4S08_003306 [Coemansia sp. RSA 1365]|nr:hypothetical protein H4S08_003306 [Coemansia sp. RSA 1365]